MYIYIGVYICIYICVFMYIYIYIYTIYRRWCGSGSCCCLRMYRALCKYIGLFLHVPTVQV